MRFSFSARGLISQFNPAPVWLLDELNAPLDAYATTAQWLLGSFDSERRTHLYFADDENVIMLF